MTIKIYYKDIKNKALGVGLVLLLVASSYTFSTPSWSVHSASTPPPVPTVSLDRSWYSTEELATIKVIDFSENANPSAIDEVTVDVSSLHPAGITITLRETGTDTGIFVGSVTFTHGSSNDPLNLLQVDIGDVVTVSYTTDAVIPAGTYPDDLIMAIGDIAILERGLENVAVPKFDLDVHSAPVTPTTINTKAMIGDFNISKNPGRSVDPRVAASGSNGYIVWRDNSIGNYDILFRAAPNNGTTLGNEQNLSKNVGSSVLQKIAASDKNVYVVWSDRTPSNYDILFRASNDNGNTWSPPLGTNATNLSSNAGFSIAPQIAASGSNVYVVWRDTGKPSSDIFFRASNDNGVSFGGVQNLSNNAGFSTDPKLVASGNSVYVVWIDHTPGNYDIFFMASNDNGITWNTDLGGDPFNVSDNAGSSSAPQITVFDDDVYILWRDNTPGNYDIFFMASNDNGVSFGGVQNLSNNPGNSFDPRIAASDINVYVLYRQSGKFFVRASNDAGSNFDGAVNVINGIEKPYSPQLAASGDNVYVLFRELGPAKSAGDVYLITSEDNGAAFGAALNVSNDPNISPSSQIATSGDRAYLTWIDQSSTTSDINAGSINFNDRSRNSETYKVGKHLFRDNVGLPERVWDPVNNRYVGVRVTSSSDTVVMSGTISVKFKENPTSPGVIDGVEFYDANMFDPSPRVTETWSFLAGTDPVGPSFRLSPEDIVVDGNNANVTLRGIVNIPSINLQGEASVKYVFREGQPLKHEVRLPPLTGTAAIRAVQQWTINANQYQTNVVGAPVALPAASLVPFLQLDCIALSSVSEEVDRVCTVLGNPDQIVNFVQFNLSGEPIATEILALGIGSNVDITRTSSGVNFIYTFPDPFNAQGPVLDPLTCTTGCTVINQDGHGIKNAGGSGTSCTGANTRNVSETVGRVRVPSTSSTVSCTSTFIDWNHSISSGTITNVQIGFNVDAETLSSAKYCDYTSIIDGAAGAARPSAQSDSQLWSDLHDGIYFTNNSACNTTGWKNLDLSVLDPDTTPNPENDIQVNLASGWYAVGIKLSSETREGTTWYSNIKSQQGGSPYPVLTITYT